MGIIGHIQTVCPVKPSLYCTQLYTKVQEMFFLVFVHLGQLLHEVVVNVGFGKPPKFRCWKDVKGRDFRRCWSIQQALLLKYAGVFSHFVLVYCQYGIGLWISRWIWTVAWGWIRGMYVRPCLEEYVFTACVPRCEPVRQLSSRVQLAVSFSLSFDWLLTHRVQ